MSIVSRYMRKIGICLLLLSFVFVTIVLSVDAPPALSAVVFTLIFMLEILFTFSPNPPQLVANAYRFRIHPRGPPTR
jgi:hypothetical protein